MYTRMIGVAALALACGCGGEYPGTGAGGAACGDFAPCGGDVLGLWTIESGCSSMETWVAYSGHPACQNVPKTVETTFPGGTIVFREDGVIEARLAVHQVETVEFEDDCLRDLIDLEPSAACAQLDAPLTDQATGELVGHNVCTYGGGACRCVGTADLPELTATEPYEVVGTEIRLSGDGSGSPICVSGDRLELGGSAVERVSRTAPGVERYLALVRSR